MSLYKCPNVISIVLDWNNSQNGMLIGFIGIVSALLQGGYVRRSMSKTGEAVMARRGVLSCAIGLILLAVLPQLVSSRTTLAIRVLYTAAICLGFTSATVVNALTAHASLQCDESIDEVTGKPLVTDPELAKGKALGKFRSSGQLGRAIGPLLGMCFVPFAPSFLFLSFLFSSIWKFISSLFSNSSSYSSLCIILDCRPLNYLRDRSCCDVCSILKDENIQSLNESD